MNIDKNILGSLSDEQKKKIEAARTPEELLAIAKETGYELTPDQLEAVSGGRDHSYECLQYCPLDKKV